MVVVAYHSMDSPIEWKRQLDSMADGLHVEESRLCKKEMVYIFKIGAERNQI